MREGGKKIRYDILSNTTFGARDHDVKIKKGETVYVGRTKQTNA